MNEFTSLLQQGNAAFFIPSAILLGALHGLEPGHSKTMMAAFIIAIKGTVRQAVMLGLAATLSHTAIVWLIAFGGMVISNKFTAAAAEPWLQLISALIILTTAGWMFWRTWRGERNWLENMQHQGVAQHDHAEARRIDTGHGWVELAIIEREGAARWRLASHSGNMWTAADVSLTVRRPGAPFAQIFEFEDCQGALVSRQPVAEPHQFTARLSLGHRGHQHDYDVEFDGHSHHMEQSAETAEYQDAHALAHASEIERRFNGREVTNTQILLFGLTGGLLPCPAAVTVLLICIQLKALAMGATLVVCFSLGLALTLVTVGVGAAISVRQVAKRWSGFSTLARRAPYFSSLLIGAVGIYMAIHGVMGMMS